MRQGQALGGSDMLLGYHDIRVLTNMRDELNWTKKKKKIPQEISLKLAQLTALHVEAAYCCLGLVSPIKIQAPCVGRTN